MKSIVLKENLRQGLQTGERISGKSISLPILSNILLRGVKNILEISATNLEFAIVYQILSKNTGEWQAVVSAKTLSQLIGTIAGDQVTLQSQEKGLVVEGQNNKATLKVLPGEEFPVIPSIQNKTEYGEVATDALCEALDKVSGIASLGTTRPEISGVLFSFSQKECRLAATDSFRLGESVINLQKKGMEASFILPQRASREIVATFGGRPGVVRITTSPTQAEFEHTSQEDASQPQIRLISRLIDGEYPNYQEIIPRTFQTKVRAKRTEFLNHLRTAAIFANRINEAKISIDPKKKGVEFRSQSPDLGENVSFMAATVEGTPQETSFSWRFLSDGLSSIKDDVVEFSLSGEDGPAVLRGAKEEDYLYVVMPLKT
ncbi:MAG: DNA polymerase III subunit beta [Parcubacteria group bacterium]|nr:DNA polymerase III subunit beta [Parcubacteria group bacterium]MBI4217285.1 DNA polymerase III subunit beta [Parcubacteria group bacterium]